MIHDPKQKLCPVDKEPIIEVFSDRSALLDIIRIKVYCLHRRQGCEWTGMIFYLVDHGKECKFAIALKKFKIIELEQPAVKDVAHRLDLWGSKLNKFRKETTITKTNTMELSARITKVSAIIENNSDSIFATKASMHGLEPRIEGLEAGLKDQKEASDVQFQRSKNFAQLLAESFSESNSAVTQNITKKFEAVSSRIHYVNKKIQDIGPALELTVNEFSSQLVSKMHKLEKERKKGQDSVTDLDLKIRLFQATTMDGKYMWKIDNYLRRLNEARAGKIQELYSPPLFTSIFGYRVCCKLYLNGNPSEPDGLGTHIAFYIIIMRGEYDRLLPFPFSRKFKVTLLSHGHHSDISRTILPNKTDPGFQEPKEEMNPPVGYSTFVSHSQLSSNKYLWDDSLFFNINFSE